MSFSLNAQKKSLNYYLPNIEYDESIQTPEEYLGYQIGEWHISHDQLLAYSKYLSSASKRVKLKEYARSHENRALINLIYTSEENQDNIEKLREDHLKESNGKYNKKAPLVLYQGYSIHGNEASGSNAAMLVAYYLAAGKDSKITQLLKNNIVIIDPCYNPDGLQRFSTWVNMHRSKNLNPDENDREFSEVWPGGRTNHYWFDLNRDWLLLVHPESQGRIRNYHYWKPNVLTDHHEMGKNSTFFFQPGVPSRTNPNTPQKNQQLTEDIAQYHMKALDKIGSEYFMKKRFDDYYYGKGSTYPDANGAVGILFEQASARGHLQEKDGGLLSFPFAIRNQVTTSLSTQEAVLDMRNKLKKYQVEYYKNRNKRASENPVKGYIFYDVDSIKLNGFLNLLNTHNIVFNQTTINFKKNKKSFPKRKSYVVSLNQKEYTLAKTIFEKVNSFGDSIFYDVSSWTMPLAFGLEYESLKSDELTQIQKSFSKRPMATRLTKFPIAFESPTKKDTSANRTPKIAMLVGNGISSYEAGELWHTLDHRFDIPITKIDIDRFRNSKKLNKYDVLILPSGRYNSLDSTNINELNTWIRDGGKLVAIGSSIRWLERSSLLDVTFKQREGKDPKTGEVKYYSTEVSRNANVIGGAIFEARMDLDDELTVGYHKEEYHCFKKGTHFIEEPKSDSIDVIIRYTDSSLSSGYASKSNQEMANNSPALVRQNLGKGKIIAFMDSPVFRGYWYNGFRLYLNAILN